MPRANRYFTSGNIWHITHRCHKSDFLFKFKHNRLNWIKWLNESKNRFKVSVLNYIITCNHIHLLISDNMVAGSVSGFMQLIQGRTGQEYNFRKNRKGAFWEDRYRATAIGSDDHLFNCITYINLNMVRAGVVDDPIKWKESGYFEIQNIGKINEIIDYNSLISLLNLKSIDQLKAAQREWVKDAIKRNDLKRDSKWTESIAVGNEAFVEKIKQQLGIKALYRTIENKNEAYVLSDGEIPYKISFGE